MLKGWRASRRRGRIVVIEAEGGWRWVTQTRWHGLWWHFGKRGIRSVLFHGLNDCIMGIAAVYLDAVRSSGGLHVSRKQRRREAARIAQRLVAR